MNLLADSPLIVDLTRLLPGPYGTFLLKAYGARVVKVEDPFKGDYLKTMMSYDGSDAFIYRLLNEDKEKVYLNLKDPIDREKFLELVKKAKVLVESFRPDVMNKLGLGYEILTKLNPNLVYINLGGYLETTFDAKKAGHDLNYLAQSGILGATGKQQREIIGVPIADFAGGLALSSLVMGGLYYQKTTGKGIYLQIGMEELMESWAVLGAAVYGEKDRVPGPGEGILNGGVVCYNIYKVKDGFVTLGALEEKFWINFLTTINREYLKPGQFSPAVRGNPYYEEVCAVFSKLTLKETESLFKDADCCLKPVRELREVAVESINEGKKKAVGFLWQKF